MKRFFSAFICTLFLLTCCIGSVTAATPIEVMPYASETLSYYYVNLKSSGDNDAQVRFSVGSGKMADEIGIESIQIYKSNGSYVRTIYGSTANGLILTDSDWHSDSYEIPLSSGSYYAEVTVFATVGSITDSRTVTTSTVRIS